MPERVDFFLLTMVLLIAAFYLGMPLCLRFSQRFAAHPKLVALDLKRLERSHADFLMTRTERLFDLGFDEPTLVRIPNPSPLVTAYLIMLINRKAGDKAMVTVMVGKSVPTPIQAYYVEFSTRFETGEVFDTHNIPSPLWPPAPQTVRTQVPSVHNVDKLYRLHNYVMDKHGVRAGKVLYEPGEALDYLSRMALIKPYEEKVERGWMYYDRGVDSYRLTLKGAYLLTWGLMQPFKALRTMALQRRARRILDEFEHATA